MKQVYSWNSVSFIRTKQMFLKYTDQIFPFLLVDHLKPPFTFWFPWHNNNNKNGVKA